jgi:CRP-like cAMP-binding protein
MDSKPSAFEPLKEGCRPAPPPLERVLEAGAVVFREGDVSREVYIVLQGRLSVTKSVEGRSTAVAELAEHSVFGEMSLLDSHPRSATVTALTECRVVELPPTAFLATVRRVPPWFLAVLKVVVRRLREANDRIHRHSVPDSVAGFCRFLSLKANSDVGTLTWLPLVDEFHLVSRVSREEIRRIAQILLDRGLVRINSNQSLSIVNMEELRALGSRTSDRAHADPPSTWPGS